MYKYVPTVQHILRYKTDLKYYHVTLLLVYIHIIIDIVMVTQ